VLMARAWLFTGETQFLQGLQTRWVHWRESNPYPFGINWASTLEVAFRTLSWIWIDHLTAQSPDFSDRLRVDMRQAIGESAMYIERYLSTYFSPNTHLLGEALALFFVGVLYPEFERATFWRDHGWSIVMKQAYRQVRTDGFHFEQSVYYHVYALEMFLYARLLASRNDIPIPPEYDAVLVRMADGLASIGAGGQAPRFGDDDGGRLFDGRRNRPEHMLDPLAAAAVLYGRADWKGLAGSLREETVWLLGLRGIQQFEELSSDPQPPRSRAFRASGYYVLSSLDAVAVIDGGPHGWASGGHGHADALSLQLLARGRAWMTDPGTYSYPKEKPDRDRYRGTGAHNTLEVDGFSQAEPVQSFAWKFLPTTTVHLWREGRQFTLFHGSHDGYQRLEQPVTHSRFVLGWTDGVWLIRDVASGEGLHRLAVNWRLSPEVATVADKQWRFTGGEDTLDVCLAQATGWTGNYMESDWSPAYGAAVSAPAVQFSYEGPLPAECGTLLGWNQREWVLSHSYSGQAVSVWILRCGDRRRVAIFAKVAGTWTVEGIESDAQLLGFDLTGDDVSHFYCVEGTSVSVDGDAFVLPLESNGVSEWRPGDTAVLFPRQRADCLIRTINHLLNQPL
jgi:hypothetical protein